MRSRQASQSTKITVQRYDIMKRGLESLAEAKVNWHNVLDEVQLSDAEQHTAHLSSKISQKVSDKEIGCLKTMLQILSLENSCSLLSREMDNCALASVIHGSSATRDGEEEEIPPGAAEDAAAATTDDDHISGFISPSSQLSINAIRNTWKWVGKLTRCIGIHLDNSATYHQFFFEFNEVDTWMRKDLDRIVRVFQAHEAKGDCGDAQRMLDELKEASVVLRQWSAKVDRMWTSARNVLPVELRTMDIRKATPARALCGYSTREIDFDEDEDLLLLESQEESTRWRVSNGRGQTGSVPSVIILLPGMNPMAINDAVRGRLTLLEQWTDILKTLGRHIITLMLHVFREEYSQHEAEILKLMPDADKTQLLQLLMNIEEILQCIWPEHPHFTLLRDRIHHLRKILQDQPTRHLYHLSPADLSSTQTLVVQIGALQHLLDAYQTNVVSPLKDLWKQWSIIRISPEVNGHSKTQELIEKWEKRHTANRVYFASFWQSEMPLYEMERTLAGLYKFQIAGIVLQDPAATALMATYSQMRSTLSSESQECQNMMSPDSAYLENGLEEEDFEFGIGMETKIAKTEQYSSAESEESKRFVIKSVVNPGNQEEISLQEAISHGVISPSKGAYLNASTGDVKPIPVAMKEGLIKVMFTTTKRTKEKKSSIGIITVKTIREQTRPYKVISAIDTSTGKELTREEAVERNVIDEGQGTYLNRQTGKKILIVEASDIGLVNIEYCGEIPSPEIISNTYAVHAVVDRSGQQVISFLDALRRGIVDKESGTYYDNLAGRKMYVGDAILQGYMKAKLVEDVSKLNVNTNNIFTFENTETNFKPNQ